MSSIMSYGLVNSAFGFHANCGFVMLLEVEMFLR
jgi:hypothetical protein